jgi:serine protease Do
MLDRLRDFPVKVLIAAIAGIVLALSGGSVRAQVPQAVGRAMDAVIEIYSADAEARFLGSGFVWQDGRRAITNAHVTGSATQVEARFHDGSRAIVPVRAIDTGRDLALLALPDARFGLWPSPDLPPPGTPVIALGAPMGLGFTATSGIVAAVPRQVDANVPLRLLQHDAALNPGSSGGPLIDAQGRLLGMNAQIANGSRLFFGISYAISAPDLARLVPALADGTLAPVPALGLDLRPVSKGIAAALGVAETGLLIDDVLPGGAADRAGLRAGDIILKMGEMALLIPGDLAFALDAAGADARVRIRRDGIETELEIDLTTAAAARETPQHRRPEPVILARWLESDGRVGAVDPDSALARAGLAPGDLVLRLNGRPVDPAMVLTEPFVLLVERDGRHLHLTVDPGAIATGRRTLATGNSLDLAVVRF